MTMTADQWNERFPIGTPVLAWPGFRDTDPIVTRTRSVAWPLLHDGSALVCVEGCSGGISLTHVEIRTADDDTE